MTATDELREALKDPRMTQEFFVIGQALVEVSDKLDELIAQRKAQPLGKLDKS
jgi:hypothetical protein